MDDREFTSFLGMVGTLSAVQREMVRELLSLPAPSPSAVLESNQAAHPRCAHCGGDRVGSWGRSDGLRRYRCGDCQRTFNALTGTSLARLRHKEKWLDYAAALGQALSVREAARVCDVANDTSFRWRHRFLKTPAAEKPVQLSGIVEADETFFRRSFKGSRCWMGSSDDAPPPGRAARRRGAPTGKRGTPLKEQVPVLIVRDRHKATGDAVLDGLSAQAIGAHLLPMLSQDALLCTDNAAAYAVIARKAGIRHEPINVSAEGYVRDSVFHIQNVNAYDSRLKGWMARFNGVATKYLPNYLGWRRMIENLGTAINPNAILLRAANHASNT